MKPLGTGSSEAEVYYLVCKSVYIIQHRAKHRAILKSLFIKKKKKTRRISRARGRTIGRRFSFLSSRSFLSFHEEKKNSIAIEYTFRTDWLLEEGNMAVPVWNATRWRHLLADKIQ